MASGHRASSGLNTRGARAPSCHDVIRRDGADASLGRTASQAAAAGGLAAEAMIMRQNAEYCPASLDRLASRGI